jgi:hypothetical protein
MAKSGVTVQGLPKLRRRLAAASPAAKKALDETLRDLAEPVRADAEHLAVSGIPRIGLRWSRMRVGVTNKLVYVAPRQRGTRTRSSPRSRPRFATLLEQRAMTPALEQNQARIEQGAENLFESLADRWNRAS